MSIFYGLSVFTNVINTHAIVKEEVLLTNH